MARGGVGLGERPHPRASGCRFAWQRMRGCCACGTRAGMQATRHAPGLCTLQMGRRARPRRPAGVRCHHQGCCRPGAGPSSQHQRLEGAVGLEASWLCGMKAGQSLQQEDACALQLVVLLAMKALHCGPHTPSALPPHHDPDGTLAAPQVCCERSCRVWAVEKGSHSVRVRRCAPSRWSSTCTRYGVPPTRVRPCSPVVLLNAHSSSALLQQQVVRPQFSLPAQAHVDCEHQQDHQGLQERRLFSPAWRCVYFN